MFPELKDLFPEVPDLFPVFPPLVLLVFPPFVLFVFPPLLLEVPLLEANAVVKSTEPPDPAVPETTLKALWFVSDVSFVQPLGAEVCWNSIRVPDGKGSGAEVYNQHRLLVGYY